MPQSATSLYVHALCAPPPHSRKGSFSSALGVNSRKRVLLVATISRFCIFDLAKITLASAYTVIHPCLEPSIHFALTFCASNYLQYSYGPLRPHRRFQQEILLVRRRATRRRRPKRRLAGCLAIFVRGARRRVGRDASWV